MWLCWRRKTQFAPSFYHFPKYVWHSLITFKHWLVGFRVSQWREGDLSNVKDDDVTVKANGRDKVTFLLKPTTNALQLCDKKAVLLILILFYAKTLSPTNYVCILIIFATYSIWAASSLHGLYLPTTTTSVGSYCTAHKSYRGGCSRLWGYKVQHFENRASICFLTSAWSWVRAN